MTSGMIWFLILLIFDCLDANFYRASSYGVYIFSIYSFCYSMLSIK